MKRDGEIRPLGDVCEVIAGQSPSGSAYNASGVGLPFYQGKKEFGEKFIRPPSTWTTQITKRALVGDILMSVRAPVGPINFATEEICIGRGLAAIRARPGLNQNFLFYHLLSIQSQICGRDGAVFPSISRGEICALELWVPPLSEQQGIVGILDEMLVGLATATANAGKNLKSAGEILQATINAALTSPEGNSWPSENLSSLVIAGKGISYGVVKPGRPDPSGVRVIKSQQVRDGWMDLSEDFRITNKLDKEYARTRLQGGEVLLNLVGASIGRSAIAPKEITGANVTRAVAVIPVPHELAEWVQYNLRGRVGQMLIRSSTGGTAQPVLNLREVKNLPIPLPPLEVRAAIVEKLNMASEEVANLQLLYERRREVLAELRHSVLQKAFSGELTSPPSSAIKEAAE